jgi:class 3 adenylate cyclase/tetratricopeptide (TPR) repeat protein/ribosomal protein L40E
MVCASCGAENPPSGRFCLQCGTPLALACATCGTPLPIDARFCGQCGSPVSTIEAPPHVTGAATSSRGSGPAEPATERRLVSVLFADLVGFTALSEFRDSEEVRDLLSRYFETCNTVISRYGGSVEKFIGDAVMAVWGTPVAQEDDAERAVRAALDLADAVATLGSEIGAPDLRARAGVLTGEATVNLAAQGQGMVAGDLVNTASRIQSVAEPGRVYVGEATRRVTESAIAYEDVGSHELKGKAEPVQLHRALRVVAGVRGAIKSEGLETAFVGRDRELRLVRDLFHASAEGARAHLVSVIGAAGIGKSRLAWEFFKYIDGLAQPIRWHRGRCLSYGEGVTYWALAEMVRTRAGIVEGEDPTSALAKLHDTLVETLPEASERAWVEPRLAHLLGLEERMAREREDLFAAWRLFYERLADEMPTVMVFEDMQWADASLLDFIEYLLEWSRGHRLFIVTLARPDLHERRPNWGTGRSSTSLYLEPVSREVMTELMHGLVPGLPDDLRSRILERAEGVPLYAVETSRMLLDRGLLVRAGDEYRLVGPVETLAIPETLHALIAARLDGLASEERRLLQDASVLGKTFTKSAIAALSGFAEDQLDQILSSLTRKEVLTIQADPRSPERGQYGFLQDLVRRVAYETLSKKERKTKHLRTATYLETTSGYEEDEIVEVVAAQYQEAFRAAPDAPDAPDIKVKARDMLVRAGGHAASLAANEEAQRYYEQAAELTDEPLEQAKLLERAGVMASIGGRTDEATARFEQALALLEAEGMTHPAARVSARLGEMESRRGQLDRAIERMQAAFTVLVTEAPDPDLASLAAELGRVLYFAGRSEAAFEPIEIALDLSEAFFLPEVLSNALNTKGLLALAKGRRREAQGQIKYALEVALENDVSAAAVRAYYNLAEILAHGDRYEEARAYAADGLAFARRVGNRLWEWNFLSQVYPLYCLGQWDEALALTAELPKEKFSEVRVAFLAFASVVPSIWVYRGDLDQARRALELVAELGDSSDVQDRSIFAVGRSRVLQAEGRHTEALAAAEEGLPGREALGLGHEAVKEAFPVAVDAALALGDLSKVEELLAVVEEVPPGKRPPLLEAQARRALARLASSRGDGQRVEAGFKEATGLFRELSVPFSMGVTLLEHGEWLVQRDRSEEASPLLEEAGQIFERLKAQPWLDRVGRVVSVAYEPVVAEPRL